MFHTDVYVHVIDCGRVNGDANEIGETYFWGIRRDMQELVVEKE